MDSNTKRKVDLHVKMLAIRQELGEMAIHAADLRWEYNRILHEVGKIEYQEYEEHALANHKPQK